MVDDADYDQVAQYHWCLFRDRDKVTREVRRLYAYRKWWEVDAGGVRRCRGEFMHRLVASAMGAARVDHIDHDGLNNQRSNLRSATPSQNGGNARKLAQGHSRFKGVTRASASMGRKPWLAQLTVTVEGQRRRLLAKTFWTEEEAARAYDDAARAAFGEFALVNFPESGGCSQPGRGVTLA